MWSFDGVKMSDTMEPFAFTQGERVRVRLVNDTMMAHPIHLHGHFFELVTGHGDHAPRKHTVIVQPGGTATWDLTAECGRRLGVPLPPALPHARRHDAHRQRAPEERRRVSRATGVVAAMAGALLAVPAAAQDHAMAGMPMPAMPMPAAPAAARRRPIPTRAAPRCPPAMPPPHRRRPITMPTASSRPTL